MGHPRRGERMITGMVRATQPNRISRSGIRSSIQRVDQGGLAIRREAFGRRIIRYRFFVDNLHNIPLFYFMIKNLLNIRTLHSL